MPGILEKYISFYLELLLWKEKIKTIKIIQFALEILVAETLTFHPIHRISQIPLSLDSSPISAMTPDCTQLPVSRWF